MMNLNREISFQTLLENEDKAVSNVNVVIGCIEFWQDQIVKAESHLEEFPIPAQDDIDRYNRNIIQKDQELKEARADLMKARRAIWNYLEARGEEN